MPTMKRLVEVEPRVAINATNTPGDDDSVFRITQSGSYYLPGNLTGESGKSGIEITVSNVTIDLMGHTLAGIPGTLTGIRSDAALNNLVVRNGTVTGWGGDGIDLTEGASGGRASLIEGIVATSNSVIGLRSANNGIVIRCTVADSGVHGITAQMNSLVESCTVFDSGSNGIIASDGTLVRGCTARDCSLDGIQVTLGSTAIDCVSSSNSRHGITVVNGSRAEGCTSTFNSNHGIEVDGNCVVRDNMCSNNGNFGTGAGIHVNGSDNRIEGNNVTDNDQGLDVDAAGNLIIRNAASGNSTNYTIVANNIGFYINGTLAAAVSGSSGGATIGTSSAWVNFSY
jgi:parallel beta-helix repeat protein